jgi:hypothetical protein
MPLLHSNPARGGGLYAIKPRFQALLAPLANRLAARNVHPDALTFAAVGCALLGGAALALSPDQPGLLLAIPILVFARLSLNALDGMVATRLNVARPWGMVLNELCDRLADLAFLSPLALVPGASIPLVATRCPRGTPRIAVAARGRHATSIDCRRARAPGNRAHYTRKELIHR